ncbi:MAG: hypothetical protein ACOYIF_11805 [Acetivibrionales bacterium]|jgi:hypothetical protein
MVKLVGIVSDSFTNVEISYIQEIKTFNMVTNFMDDYCKPYEIATGAMIWINDDSIIGELECIFPPIIHHEQCFISEKIKLLNGIPKLKVVGINDDIFIQINESGYIIWLTKECDIDLQINTNNIDFLFCDEQLVAIRIYSNNIND